MTQFTLLKELTESTVMALLSANPDKVICIKRESLDYYYRIFSTTKADKMQLRKERLYRKYTTLPYIFNRILKNEEALLTYSTQKESIFVYLDEKIVLLFGITFSRYEGKEPVFWYEENEYKGIKRLWEAVSPGSILKESVERQLISILPPQILDIPINKIHPADFSYTATGKYMNKKYPLICHPLLKKPARGRIGLIKCFPALEGNPELVNEIMTHIGWETKKKPIQEKKEKPKKEKKEKDPVTTSSRVNEIISKCNIGLEKEGVVMNDLDNKTKEIVVSSARWLSDYLREHNISCSRSTAYRIFETLKES